jgi:NADH-quinone oxidoreductase subunit E
MIEEHTATRQFEKLCAIIDRFGRDPANLIPVLQSVQEEYRYLPAPVLNFVANALKLPPAKVYGVATFYGHFALTPKGKYVIKVCDGTACHVKGSSKLHDVLVDRLKLTDGRTTTEDMLFTVETVSCLGACGLAPVMLVNDEVHSQVSDARAVEIVDAIEKQEAGRD